MLRLIRLTEVDMDRRRRLSLMEGTVGRRRLSSMVAGMEVDTVGLRLRVMAVGMEAGTVARLSRVRYIQS